MKQNGIFFDDQYPKMEQLPRNYTVTFHSFSDNGKMKTKILFNGTQAGDIIDDNSKEPDKYRFHDVFHYTFATILGWSPCTRALIKRKRKSNPDIDDYEDGARATITEEAISLLLFNSAKLEGLFESVPRVSDMLLDQIKLVTSPFEVATRSKAEWEKTIMLAYSLFRQLVKHNGGTIHFDMQSQSAVFEC